MYLEVTSGGPFCKLLLKAGATSKINQIPREIVQPSVENLQGLRFCSPLAGPLFLCVNTVMGGKKKFLISSWSFHCQNLWPLPLDLSLCNPEKSLLLSSLYAPVGSGRKVAIIPLATSLIPSTSILCSSPQPSLLYSHQFLSFGGLRKFFHRPFSHS